MLPEPLLPYSVRQGEVVPHFLGADDHPWLRELLDQHDRFVGRPERELEERLREPLACASPAGKRKLAIAVLRSIALRDRPRRVESVISGPAQGRGPAQGCSPRRARSELFRRAARTAADPAAIVGLAADSLGVTPAELAASLFADVPGERSVTPAPSTLSPGELALRANLALAQALVFRSTRVRIEVEGNARAVVRHARLRGLLCVVSAAAGAGAAEVEISGPLALFRRTLVYGRALGELLPLLAWCRRFRLRAECGLGRGELVLHLATGDPLFPSQEPRRYDSRLEARFAREFARLARDWELVREPEPIDAGGTLAFPDFALAHRRDPSRRWLLEIVGFWTPDYLARKLALYRAARLDNLILCIDEDRCCQGGDVPAGAFVVRFRRRVDPEAVLRIIEQATSGRMATSGDGR